MVTGCKHHTRHFGSDCSQKDIVGDLTCETAIDTLTLEMQKSVLSEDFLHDLRDCRDALLSEKEYFQKHYTKHCETT